MLIRIAQTNTSGPLNDIISRVLELASGEFDAVIFPEMFICGFDDPQYIRDHAVPVEELNSPTGFFAPLWKSLEYSKKHLILGSLPLLDQGKIYNASLVFSLEEKPGKLVCRYRKRNLFPLMNEQMIFTPGEEGAENEGRFILENDKETFSSLIRICYDLRFPEIFHDVRSGYYPELIVLPMQWPAPRTETFRTLIRARAIENQAYVVGCNRVGNDGVNDFEGGSLAAGPDGKIIAEMGNEEGYLDVNLNPQVIRDFRSRYPFLKNFQSQEIYA